MALKRVKYLVSSLEENIQMMTTSFNQYDKQSNKVLCFVFLMTFFQHCRSTSWFTVSTPMGLHGAREFESSLCLVTLSELATITATRRANKTASFNLLNTDTPTQKESRGESRAIMSEHLMEPRAHWSRCFWPPKKNTDAVASRRLVPPLCERLMTFNS